MEQKKIKMILIQIDEAHSTAWPLGLPNPVQPQKSFEERVERANTFVNDDSPPFPILIDTWENEFQEKFRAWPDKFYCINKEYIVVAKSTYGQNEDALIDVDCTKIIEMLLNK